MSNLFLIGFCLFSSLTFSQKRDTIIPIPEVRIDAYKKPTSYISATKSVSVVSEQLLQLNPPERLLESVNQIAGARMEERSPGSYRLSVRGRSLRSPFGVRDIKVYLDDFILSDASGNTYLNVISPELISKIEIYKGPEAGDFGAVTGGTLLLKTATAENKSAHISLGSYGTFSESINFSKRLGKHFVQVFQNYYRTDSYRDQSEVSRKQLFLKDEYQYAKNADLKAMLLLADLAYETPGGLTFEQMQTDRKQARPATKTLPGAAEQNAGIQNIMSLGGLSQEFRISRSLSHFLLVQGSYVDFKNPFITNFERRFETNFALRTHLNYRKSSGKFDLETRFGYEAVTNRIQIKNFDNNRGIAGNAQNFDELKNNSGFYFLSQKINFNEKLFTDFSISLNENSYDWKRVFPTSEAGAVKFADQLLPNFGATYLLAPEFSVRVKVGKGNSAPTNEEIRSSTWEFNLDLIPESGWNAEIGLRKQFGNFLFAEASYFDFRLKDAIVRRTNESGSEYFANRGNTMQKGLEFLLESGNIDVNTAVFSFFKFRFSGSFYDFKFKNYTQLGNDFSGNAMTGVPATTINSALYFVFFKKLYADYSHFYASKMPLNDANSVWSAASFIGNLQLRYPIFIEKTRVNLYFQIQNLYNTDYVLGYDTNAFGNRFYNPAAKRNFMFGLRVDFR